MKPAVLALIDELDKLRQPLAQAVAEELSLLTYDYITDDATDLLGERDLLGGLLMSRPIDSSLSHKNALSRSGAELEILVWGGQVVMLMYQLRQAFKPTHT